jgi:hypothetical protein
MPNVEAPVTPADKLQEIACKCDKKAGDKKKDTCAEQGKKKHDCCAEEIEKHKASGEDPQIDGERGYNKDGSRADVDSNGNQLTRDPMPGESWPDWKARIKGTCWPDACAVDAQGNPSQLFDFKFKCPAGSKTRKKKKGGRYWYRAKDTDTYPTWTRYKGGRTQEEKYIELGNNLDPSIDNAKNPPTVINTENCP